MSQTSWSDIEALILAAAARPPEESVPEIQRRCADEDLRNALTVVARRTWTAAAPRAVPLQLQPGTAVGPYVVVQQLGRGGMGEVFLARDGRLDRLVALKCLLPSEAAAQEVRERIVREARLAARISHPHVATVHDVLDDRGRTFIVMEYVEGASLGSVLRAEPMPETRVVQIAAQLAGALTAAHRVGIVHRDLKPGNIQVTPHGSVKILDFGIATAHASMTRTTGTTGAGVMDGMSGPAGTIGYMSPEQLLSRPVDARSDIFSLAAVLYEMATGRRAFDVRDPLDNLVAIIGGVPRADGTGQAVSERVADVIARGLEPDPDRRFQSAADMLAALEAIPVRRAAPDGRRYGAALACAAMVPLGIWLCGRLTTAIYDNTFGRTGAFADESVAEQFVWGLKSIVAPLFYAALAALSYWTAAFMVHSLVLLSPSVGRWHSVTRLRFRRVADRLRLDDPVTLAQGLAAAGLLTLALVVWWFNPLILAWAAHASTADASELRALGSDNEWMKVLYRAVLTVALLVFAAGFFRVLQLRRRLSMRRGRASVAALATIVIGLVLLAEVPYRIMWGRAERVTYEGRRCYIIGESADQYLLFCPTADVPRDRVAGRNDPRLERSASKDIENVFTR